MYINTYAMYLFIYSIAIIVLNPTVITCRVLPFLLLHYLTITHRPTSYGAPCGPFARAHFWRLRRWQSPNSLQAASRTFCGLSFPQPSEGGPPGIPAVAYFLRFAINDLLQCDVLANKLFNMFLTRANHTL